jgi:hypothetical protein
MKLDVEGLREAQAPEPEEPEELTVPPEVIQAQTTCWFCGVRPPTTGSELMQRISTQDLTRAAGKEVDPSLVVEVLLQRCLACKRIHERPENYGGIGCLVSFGIYVLVGLQAYFAGKWKNELFLVILLSPLAWFGIGWSVGWLRNRGSRTRPLREANLHPAYQHQLATDWTDEFKDPV